MAGNRGLRGAATHGTGAGAVRHHCARPSGVRQVPRRSTEGAPGVSRDKPARHAAPSAGRHARHRLVFVSRGADQLPRNADNGRGRLGPAHGAARGAGPGRGPSRTADGPRDWLSQGRGADGALSAFNHLAMSSMTCSATWPGTAYSTGVEGPLPAMKRWLRPGYSWNVTFALPPNSFFQPDASPVVT